MPTTLRRSDTARNMDRFYAVRLQADLLDGWTVTREWGRHGTAGRVRIDVHPDLATAEVAAAQLLRRKQGRGYR